MHVRSLQIGLPVLSGPGVGISVEDGVVSPPSRTSLAPPVLPYSSLVVQSEKKLLLNWLPQLNKIGGEKKIPKRLKGPLAINWSSRFGRLRRLRPAEVHRHGNKQNSLGTVPGGRRLDPEGSHGMFSFGHPGRCLPDEPVARQHAPGGHSLLGPPVFLGRPVTAAARKLDAGSPGNCGDSLLR